MTEQQLHYYMNGAMDPYEFLELYMKHRRYNTEKIPNYMLYLLLNRLDYAVNYMCKEFNIEKVNNFQTANIIV